jgi:diguanylate cyclase (GGDEF)-like protein
MPSVDNTAAYESLIQFLYRAPIGLVQANLAGEIEMINPTAARLLMPLSSDGSLDNLFAVLGRVAPQLQSLVAALGTAGGELGDELRVPLRTPAGEAQQVLSIQLQRLDANRLMTVVNDISLQVQQEQLVLERRLHQAARTDSLTQMPNRAELRERIAQLQCARVDDPQHSFALLFLNCDRFKQINDRLGQAVGDQLLGLLAARLRSVLRVSHTEVARVGGDEFVVLIQALTSSDEAFAIGQRVIAALRRHYPVNGHTLTCSVSGGLVFAEQSEGDADALLRDASVAMVEAKRQGGARFVSFEPGMRERAIQRGRVESDLRVALVEQQLFVVYQPIVALQEDESDSTCAGVEALVRWRHPLRGVVPPLEFIGIAEECGLIGAIGDCVLRTAARQLVSWQRDEGSKAPRWVAVNLSRAQLQQPNFVASVRQVLRDTGLPAACLQLEVTESLAAQDTTVQAVLKQLKALGVTLALDDFGTGYSSLASLHEFAVDVVKIDRSFTSQVDSSKHHHVLVQATVLVARSLGMSTVVEGIETQAQAAIVKRIGCDKGQGYLYSRPLEADALTAWLRVNALALAAC